MAKGQLRSNREKKKPKQNTASKPVVASTAPVRPAMPALVKRERRPKD